MNSERHRAEAPRAAQRRPSPNAQAFLTDAAPSAWRSACCRTPFAASWSHADARVYLAVLLAGIGAIYARFAVADGCVSAIVVQVMSAAGFLNIAFFGVLLDANVLLGLGFRRARGLGLDSSRGVRLHASADLVAAVLRGQRR